MSETPTWTEANRRHFAAAVAEIGAQLSGFGTPPRAKEDPPWPEDLAPPALERICRLFDLSPFERSLLLLCAGVQMDSDLAKLCPDGTPTFGFALAHLPQPHWSALRPDGPLRYWQLIEMADGPRLPANPLYIDERVLHALAGVESRDEALIDLAEPVSAGADGIVPSHRRIARQMAATWAEAAEHGDLPVLQLCGPESAAKPVIAALTGGLFDLALWRLSASVLPRVGDDLERLLRRLQRESMLTPGIVLLDCDVPDGDEGHVGAADLAAAARLVAGLSSPVIVAVTERRHWRGRSVLSFEVEKPGVEEQRQLWRQVLEQSDGELVAGLEDQIGRLVDQFCLGSTQIQAACSSALASLNVQEIEIEPETLGPALWRTCRTQARPRLEGLAQHIDPSACWDDLVLAPGPKRLLREIALQVRWRARVHEQWGFGGRGGRGLGIAVLFAGPSGTGKTLAAEVIASDLDLALYRIDLSAVVSKYIGETEKNLERIFGAAEEAGAVLLFDEADALFGRRTEIQDSHDRYANVEVSYLLQRMESYRGLAVLTTNLKESVDQAFLRRFRFVADFPFPDVGERRAIWQRVLPSATPTEALDLDRWADLQLTGGNIRNIALSAAFLAAADDRPVNHHDLARATQRELIKLGQPIPAGLTSMEGSS